MSKIQSFDEWLTSPEPGHAVIYYSSDDAMVKTFVNYIKAAVESDERCIILIQTTTLRKLYQALSGTADMQQSIREGICRFFSAEAIYDDLSTDGMPDEKKFMKIIGGLIDATPHDKPVRFYGDMVAYLLRSGKPEAALEIEKLWNKLAETHRFSRLCAYPESLFTQDATTILTRSIVDANHSMHGSTVPTAELVD